MYILKKKSFGFIPEILSRQDLDDMIDFIKTCPYKKKYKISFEVGIKKSVINELDADPNVEKETWDCTRIYCFDDSSIVLQPYEDRFWEMGSEYYKKEDFYYGIIYRRWDPNFDIISLLNDEIA